MATEIVMPKLSDTMTEGKLVSWKKAVGDQVVRGDTIAEVETDKATMELEAFSSGTLLETRVKPGDTIPVGSVIAVVGAPEEGDRKALDPGKEVKAPAPEPQELPELFKPSRAESTEAAEKVESVSAPAQQDAGVPGAAAKSDKASPLVRRLARERGIDLALVPGSGPEGRILQEDLEKYFQRRKKSEKEPAQREEIERKGGEQTPVSGAGISRMRAAIARTVTESWRTIPHFSVTISVEMDGAEHVLDQLKSVGVHATVNDLIVKAAAVALVRFPQINASFADESIVAHPDVNIGIAVALEEGLFVPVIKGCCNMSLKEISVAVREVVERVRNGTVTEDDLSGGTFTISNLGMYGIEEFVAVIHPSQGAILAVGGIHDQPVIRQKQVVPARLMRLTLSADHRLIDGAYAARFLAEVKKTLEAPVTLL